jgi:transcriptional regulator GlxA family with amidase domain
MEEHVEARRVAVVLFHRFELLDVAGPVEILGSLPDRFEVSFVGPAAGPVQSAQGLPVEAGHSYDRAPRPGIVLVPGGIGTRTLVTDRLFGEWLAAYARRAELVASVCTGSALLASAGLLDGYRATSNKRAFAWAREQGPLVEWIERARWVEDRDRWTSSGVAAGMDMSLALVEKLHSHELATAVADAIEYEWHRDPGWDPFAAKQGRAPG